MAKHKMHGLAGLKEDSMDVLVTGASALAGAAVAKMVTGFVADIGVEKDKDGNKKPVRDNGKENTPSLPEWVSPLVPLAVSVGIVWAGDKYNLSGNAKKAAVGAAAGMAAFGIAKLAVAILPKEKPEDVGNTLAKYLPFAGLGEVDTYDSGLLAGLGMYDASVNRYMMAGSPTQVQTLAGAPIQVKALAGAPTQVQMLAGAPMSATLM